MTTLKLLLICPTLNREVVRVGHLLVGIFTVRIELNTPTFVVSWLNCGVRLVSLIQRHLRLGKVLQMILVKLNVTSRRAVWAVSCVQIGMKFQNSLRLHCFTRVKNTVLIESLDLVSFRLSPC